MIIFSVSFSFLSSCFPDKLVNRQKRRNSTEKQFDSIQW